MAAIVIRFVDPKASKSALIGRRENGRADTGRSLIDFHAGQGIFLRLP
jgi:hypothetical protein